MARSAWETFPPVHYDNAGSLHGAFEAAVDRYPEHIALRFDADTYTFREVDGLANAFARLLADRGVSAHDRVALMASNRPEFVLTVLAVLKLGAALVTFSPAWKRSELDAAVNLTNPVCIVHDAVAAELLGSSAHDRALVDLDDDMFSRNLRRHSGQRIDVELDWANTEAVLVFSSGTTGLPKAVRHTHKTMGAAVVHWRSALGLTSNDRLQVATPPFHVLGLLNLITAAATGVTVRLHRRFDIDEVLDCVQTDRITIEMAVAPIAMAMAQHPRLESYDLSSLRYIIWGATPITGSVARTVTERTGVGWLPGYGASEVPVISLNPVNQPDLWRLDSAGLPVNDVQVRVVDLETGDELAVGGVGELQISSPSTMAGYLPEDANADAFADGWYRTGDIGFVEADGWIHITDRAKEMIKVKGFQVAPAEIEGVLLGHEAVADCAVFGVDDLELGEAVVATVLLRPGAVATADALCALVTEHLAPYKQIRHLRFVTEIPRLPSGKVLRRTLKQSFTEAP